MTLEFCEFFLKELNALSEQAPVGFQLCFARTAQADAAFLTLQMGPPAHQTGSKMLKLSQFYLQFTLVAFRALRKDIQNQTGAINDAPSQTLLQITLLGRGEVMIENNQGCAGLLDCGRNFIDFAATCECRWIRPGTSAFDDRRDFRADRLPPAAAILLGFQLNIRRQNRD